MKENGYEYVDFGLPSGTMWATCNIGADKPEDYGLLFQFGHVDGCKYGDITIPGKIYDTGDILDSEDDVAHVNMGGKWRMPTKDELQELVDNTIHTVETISGVKGIMFISKINDKQLFIPFGGFWYNGSFRSLGSFASVWSSKVHSSYVYNAYRLSCYSGGDANVYIDYRAYAFSVRGVFNPNEVSKINLNMLI